LDAVSSAPAAPFRVGDWHVDPATNELRRGEETTRLEPLAMDVLVLLAARGGQVVSREELLAAAWPGVVVGDEALSQVVAKLRRAFGDDARTPTVIETIAKRGYRLIAPVTPVAGPAIEAPPPGPMAKLAALAGIAFVLALAAYLPWMMRSTPPAPNAAATPSTAQEWVTVTVLPFESIGAGGEHDYLARGIGDGLMTELGRLSSLRVIDAGRLRSGEVGKHASYAVSGSVQRDGPLLRLHARLVDTRTGQQVWSERFERPFGELFPVQDEIIRRVTEALPARVTQSERERLARRHTKSLEAYALFLRAQALFLARGARENREARELYRKALELDPQFARAYAGLALTHAMDHRLQVNADARASLERALELAESARQIDPGLAEVHWAVGFVHAQARRHREAIADLDRAIALNPSFADAYAMKGGIHTYLGEPEKSITAVRTALRFKPDGGYLVYLVLGRAYYFMDDREQALINLREAVMRNPSDIEVRLYLAATLAESDPVAASWEMEEVRMVDPAFDLEGWLASYPLASERHREKLRRAVTSASAR
jgi:DNA-binding winged helix-turn-helix (wHTH) protein/TolB-like protein/Tfp pilus assembly protein PilF